ncbi:Maf family protein [Tsuneonella mangrovi]|uniref:Maf family protein n=1 Tax=Tsuneonella mangrovi TaxID=1982042 RepID=UPI000BA264C8|nr:nucleoside triphosphate pyrophosphatase [Tsuneonella mangrovi]
MTLVLASKSASRCAMLDAAGVEFDSIPADVDERAIEDSLETLDPAEIAIALAQAKALVVSRAWPDRLVLGSDSLVSIDGERFDKPASRMDAARHLRRFSGQTMELHSGAALSRGGNVLWSAGDVARLKVRDLSNEFIEAYLEAEWPAIAGCVGCFRIEARGAQLFETIEGDQFTVLGMPLLAVLGALRVQGELLA